MLINNPKIDLADDTTLTEKQKEAIINATIEFVLFLVIMVMTLILRQAV